MIVYIFVTIKRYHLNSNDAIKNKKMETLYVKNADKNRPVDKVLTFAAKKDLSRMCC